MQHRALPPFIDCHHHIWDPRDNSHPWLTPNAQVDFRYGDHSSIKGRYLAEDYDRDAAGINVVGHVTMEGEWNDDDPVAETRWIASQFEQRPDYLAHVARAILHRPDVERVLAGHGAFAFVRGIRHKPVAAPAPNKILPGEYGSLSDPAWRRGYAKLSQYGFHYELQSPWWHVDDLLDLVATFPETQVILNHMFMPETRDPDVIAAWKTALARAASAPQVTLKISGMGIKGRRWHLDDHREILAHAIDCFGPTRAMVASNFPVDRLCGDFPTILDGYNQAFADLSDADRNALFHDTALRVYRIPRQPLNADAVQFNQAQPVMSPAPVMTPPMMAPPNMTSPQPIVSPQPMASPQPVDSPPPMASPPQAEPMAPPLQPQVLPQAPGHPGQFSEQFPEQVPDQAPQSPPTPAGQVTPDAYH